MRRDFHCMSVISGPYRAQRLRSLRAALHEIRHPVFGPLHQTKSTALASRDVLIAPRSPRSALERRDAGFRPIWKECFSCPLKSSASPSRSPAPLPARATRRRRRSRRRPSRTSSPAATFSASPRPAPARPPPSRCRSSIASPPRRPRRARAAAACLVLSPDARARRPDRRELPHLRPHLRLARRRHLRRRRPWAARCEALRERRRHPGRHARPPARPHAAARSSTSTSVEVFVLDEADRMLDMGFIHAVRRSSRMLPRKRQTLFFSATMPHGDRASSPAQMLTRSGPRRGDAAGDHRRPRRAARHLRRAGQQARAARRHPARRRRSTARSSSPAPSTAPTRSSRSLDQGRHRAPRRSTATSRRASASGRSRLQAPASIRVLVATDIAARGIDVDGVTHVVNYDLPERARELRPPHRPHRARRRGRHRISFCDREERAYLAPSRS